jgi:hypothetical protein
MFLFYTGSRRFIIPTFKRQISKIMKANNMQKHIDKGKKSVEFNKVARKPSATYVHGLSKIIHPNNGIN